MRRCQIRRLQGHALYRADLRCLSRRRGRIDYVEVSMTQSCKCGKDIPCICPVDSNFVSLCWIIANIFDVTEDMASTILTDKVAKNSTQAHVCNCRFVIAPFLNWEALEQDKPLAV